MASAGMIYRNYNSTDTTSQGLTISELPQPPASWEREGYFFKEWNTSRDGSGTSYQPGDGIPFSGEAYAIWYGDYIEAVKDSSGVEHPIKDIISGYITSASVPSASSTTPKMDGTAAVGTETAFARGDHIHPIDTSRQAKITASGILKGNGSGTVTAATAGTDYQAPLTFDGTYNASTNKAATVSTVTNAINALDGGTIGTGSTTKTITSLSQTNGNVSATFSDIAFPVTSVNGQTGAVTTAEKFVITATAISGTDYYNLDKTYADINVAIGDNKYVTIEDIDMTYPYTTTVSQGVVFGATLIATGEGNQLMAVTDGILVVQPDSGTNAMGIAVHSTNSLPTMSDIPTASSTTPLMDGTADVGIQTYIYARADHVHPTDTSRQAVLVSGTNIKTINNESILGSGNISISAGSGDTLIATVTFTGTQYTESYSCDTTYDSLYSALSSGRDVILRYKDTSSDNNLYNFFLSEGFNTIHSGDILYFSRVTDNGEIHRFSVTNTDYWAYSSYKTASKSYVQNNYAALASPSFTGNPTAPTQAAGNNSTRIATTAFVQGEKKNLVADGDSSLDISSLADLKTQLSTWFATLEDCSTAFFWFHASTAFSLFTPGDKLVRLQRATSKWGFAEIFSDFGASSNTMRARYFGHSDIYMNFGNGAWTDPVPIRATLGNYYDYANRPTDANTAIPHVQYDGGLYTFAVTGSMTSNKPVSDGHIIQSTWDYTGDYSTQLFLPNATTNGTSDNGNRHVQVRGCYNGTWKTWESLAWMSDVTDAINTAIGSAILASY